MAPNAAKIWVDPTAGSVSRRVVGVLRQPGIRFVSHDEERRRKRTADYRLLRARLIRQRLEPVVLQTEEAKGSRVPARRRNRNHSVVAHRDRLLGPARRRSSLPVLPLVTTPLPSVVLHGAS